MCGKLLQEPILLHLRRDEFADEIQRRKLYANLTASISSSRSSREDKAASIGISEASYSTPNGTPFFHYFREIGLQMYRLYPPPPPINIHLITRSFPNCPLHALDLNESYVISCFVDCLSTKGKEFLRTIAQRYCTFDDLTLMYYL